MKLLMRKNKFNTVSRTTNPHRCKDFKRKPWYMYLSQVLFFFKPGLKKKKSITVGPVFSEYNFMVFNSFKAHWKWCADKPWVN